MAENAVKEKEKEKNSLTSQSEASQRPVTSRWFVMFEIEWRRPTPFGGRRGRLSLSAHSSATVLRADRTNSQQQQARKSKDMDDRPDP